jgi:hypothetical protein
MPTVSKSYTPADIFQGGADIYLGVTPPPSAVPPVAGTNTLTLDANGQPPIASTGQIATAALNAGGTGYTVGDTLFITQSGAVAGMIRVATLSGSAVATFVVINGGRGYSVATGLATVGGTGSGCTIDISTITAGYHLGLTEGPASISISPKFNLIRSDQHAAEIDAAFVSQTCEIDFTLKEFVLANMQRTFSGLFSATYWNLAAGGTNPAADFVQVGSSFSSYSKTSSLLLVAARRDVPGKYVYALAYRAYIKSAWQMTANRAKENVWKLKAGCILDTSRIAKDMCIQIVKQV